MEFKDLEELRNSFKQGKFKLVDEMIVSGLRYRRRNSPPFTVDDIFLHNHKIIAVYSGHQSDKIAQKEAGLEEWILMLWAATGRMRLVPFDARTVTRARVEGRPITEEMQKYEKPDNIIGSTVEVKFTSLPGSGSLKGKVDTGASICSLHADNYQINRGEGTITFRSPELSQNELTVPLVDQQSVKSADGGSEYRPVIELNIKINDKLINNVKFNLNDRAHMEFPVLVGKNALGDGKFLIDPRMDEGVQEDMIEYDFTSLQEELNNEVGIDLEQKNIVELYTLIKESDISFADLIQHIRTDVAEIKDLDD